MRPTVRGLVYAGVALLAVGFALIAYSWLRVAALTAVPFQIPYIVSGGMTGLALILLGLTALNIHVKLRDADRRDRQIDQLSELLDQIRVLLGGEEHEPVAEATDDEAPGVEEAEPVPVEGPDSPDADTDEVPLARSAP